MLVQLNTQALKRLHFEDFFEKTRRSTLYSAFQLNFRLSSSSPRNLSVLSTVSCESCSNVSSIKSSSDHNKIAITTRDKPNQTYKIFCNFFPGIKMCHVEPSCLLHTIKLLLIFMNVSFGQKSANLNRLKRAYLTQTFAHVKFLKDINPQVEVAV